MTDELILEHTVSGGGAVSLKHIEARLTDGRAREFSRSLSGLQESKDRSCDHPITFCSEHSEAARESRPLLCPHEVPGECEMHRLPHVRVRDLLVLMRNALKFLE